MKKLLVLSLMLLAATPMSVARELVVTSTADSGTGTLRWALESARTGDTITFDPSIFPPNDPSTIYPQRQLPAIGPPVQRITIDASNAGVIIDGRDVPGEDFSIGLQIYSDGNTVMGLQIVNFAGYGMVVCVGKRNIIGGDRGVGVGPTGQGNLLSGNNIGIDLCNHATENTVTGNVIGTDPTESEPWGNTRSGIWIEDNAYGNIIGPDNIIAYNGHAVEISGPRTLSNTIKANRIYRNDYTPIFLRDGGNGELEAPMLAEVDASGGRVAGWACPDCVVEVFAYREDDRSFFEGKTQTDKDSWFTFQKEGPLVGQIASATATDAQGNTSGLSGSVLLLQTGNVRKPSHLEARSSSELEDNRIGVHFINLWHLEGEVFPNLVLDPSHLLQLGVKRVRFSINDLDSHKVVWSKPEFSIDAAHDEFISSLADNGVEMTYVLSFWDTERAAQDWTVPSPRFKTESEIQRYLDFARFIVRHFKDRIERYEIWNEPSLPDKIQSIEVEDYIRLVERVVPVIREEYPEAKIVVGGTHSLIDEDSQQYLSRILRSNIMPLVDVVSWHPMYGSSPEYDWHREYYYDYPSIVREIRNLASAHGFTGEYVADEMHWNTPDIPEPPWPTYTETKSAKYYARMVVMHLGMDVPVTLILLQDKPQMLETLQNACTSMAGHEAIDMPVDIDIEYDGPVAYCAFRDPNGDQMLAIWTDDVARDEDPGVPSTVTFPGLVAGTVTGIDVLHGFEQELVFEIDGDNTLVRDVLVKDYPILLRLSSVVFGSDYQETIGDSFHRIGDIDAASGSSSSADRDGDGVPDHEDLCPDWPGSPETSGC